MRTRTIISTDPIADMLTRIRNAIAVNKTEISLPYSRIKETVAKILVDNGFLATTSVSEDDGMKYLNIIINADSHPVKITEIKRLSSPGRRVYVKSEEIPTVKHGRGMVVVSTSKGVMTGVEAKNNKLGGELICQVY